MDKNISIEISAGAPLLFAALLLILPLQWVGAIFLSMTVHECSHAIAIFLCGGGIHKITVGGRGIYMETEQISGIRESICALAGPLGSLSLLLLAKWLPRTAICGVVHGLYNLLPLFPMDGGRVLRGILYTVLSPPKAHRLFVGIQRVMAALLILCCGILISRAGIVALLLGFLFLRKIHLPRSHFGGTIGEITKKRYGYDRVTQTNPAHGAKTRALHRWGV